MGVKYFFSFIKSRFPESIVQVTEPLSDIDNLMIDLNGIFHTCAQKVYGTNVPYVQYYLTYKPRLPTLKQQLDTFNNIWSMILDIINLAPPRRRLILAIDGVAPFAKQTQQRQRRFRAVKDKVRGEWDSNCITPGTQFMDHLSKFIDFKIREFITTSEQFRNLEIIFSNEKCPQEGEHKIIRWVRSQPDSDESYCLHGMDADLVMLGLSTGKKKFKILRQNHLNHREHFLIELDSLAENIIRLFMPRGGGESQSSTIIRDFVFMLFSVGNDFLPHLPAIEILEGGIEILAEAYKTNYEQYGSLTESRGESYIFRKQSFCEFLKILGQYEQNILDKKANHFIGYIDPILEECKKTKSVTGKNGEIYNVDFEKYKTMYYHQKLNNTDLRQICLDYIEGLQWVLDYYTTGITSWKWYYPHYYTIFSSDLAKFVQQYQHIDYPPTKPLNPFEQLLCVLPPFSSNILPSPLNTLLEEKSPLKKYYPDCFEVDLEGKRNDWEGIAILPFIRLADIQTYYRGLVNRVSPNLLKRNIVGKTYVYNWMDSMPPEIYKSFYGNITTKVLTNFIDFC